MVEKVIFIVKRSHLIMGLFLIFVIQFVDSYCTELFGKLQSFSIRDFIIQGSNMAGDKAASYMSRAMRPFYVLGMLTPFVKSFVDILEKRIMLIMNLLLLTAGSVICLCANNLTVYLLGNGLLILGYSLDIHIIYLVEKQNSSIYQ